MHATDVIVVGGGPAGSSCAWGLVRAGLTVRVIDRARFPRDKVCAGWITPPIVDALALDLREYARSRTLQPISAFETGLLGDTFRTTEYGRVMSYGIRRYEFDHYLLSRTGAAVSEGEPVTAIRRVGDAWIVNETYAAPVLVGAGGHFCPVARHLNPDVGREAAVVAQEIEVPVDEVLAREPRRADCPTLAFERDLEGYGWVFVKGAVVNIGLGRLGAREVRQHVERFWHALVGAGVVRASYAPRWRGHAYLVASLSGRRVAGDGILLIGDAAGLAAPASGEGIRRAVESGLLAAQAIAAGAARDARVGGAGFGAELARRYQHAGARERHPRPAGVLARTLRKLVSPVVFHSPWATRHLVLDRAFLQFPSWDIGPLAQP